jgi:hypothetical protein
LTRERGTRSTAPTGSRLRALATAKPQEARVVDVPIAAHTSRCPFAFLPMLKEPEKLVGVGFRCWMTGYHTGEIACWEEVWKSCSEALGPTAAREVVSAVACWVRSIKDNARREIEVFPIGCRGFCRDECVAISMVAACQHDVRRIMTGCATTLLGCPPVDEVMEGVRTLAGALTATNQVLSPSSILQLDNG